MICCNLFYGDLRQSDIHIKARHYGFEKGCPEVFGKKTKKQKTNTTQQKQHTSISRTAFEQILSPERFPGTHYDAVRMVT